MTTLAIDTSTKILSVAIISGNKVCTEYTANLNETHGTKALAVVDYLLKQSNTQKKELTKIAVAKGPGSYTGVRIGVTLAKTLAWTLGVDLMGVSSLEVLAQNGKNFCGYVVPLIDARRDQAFTALFLNDGNKLQRITKDSLQEMTQLLKKLKNLKKPFLFVGNDAPIFQKIIQSELGKNFEISDELPRAGFLGLLAQDRTSEDPVTFVPNYARLPEAEINWLKAINEGGK